jgi:hypothetical protein
VLKEFKDAITYKDLIEEIMLVAKSYRDNPPPIE